MIDIGVVCEGGHDFIVIEEIVAAAMGAASVRCTALQPLVDATLAQISQGGFPRVKIWCLQNSGSKFYDNIKPGLFGSSPAFDFIIIHLDGDVLEKSGWFGPADIAVGASSTNSRVQILHKWIHQALAFSGSDELVTAIPVLSTDSWVLAGVRPDRNFELVECKKRLERYLAKFFGSKKRSSLKNLMPYCAANSKAAADNNFSLFHFIDQLP